MNVAPIMDLAVRWEERAETFRSYGAEPLATACEKHAEELRERIVAWRLELLTLEEAASEAGVAYDTAQRKVASGDWPNAGRTGKPRVRRCDVLPGMESPKPERADSGDVVDDLADTVLRSRGGG